MAVPDLSSVYTFAEGCVHSADVLRVLVQVDELNAKKVPNTMLLRYEPATRDKEGFDLDWTAIKIVSRADPSLLVLAVGPEGQVCVATAAGMSTEQIGTSNEGPPADGLIRDMRIIGSGVFAAGMGRQVYQRVSAGRWKPIHGRILQPQSLTEVRGFNALHGLDESEFLAVGWYGEIYRRKGKTWREEDSGTNVILNDVHVAPDGTAYAAGQMGVLLRNAGKGWRIIDHGGTKEQIYGLQWFADRLFLATEDELFSLEKDKLKRIKFQRESTFQSLDANDGVLLSVGAKDIWWTRDARKWNRVD